jgi:hypothetical protein
MYCDVFGRMPSLLDNRKVNDLVVARQPLVRYFHGYAHHCYTVALHGNEQYVGQCFHWGGRALYKTATEM